MQISMQIIRAVFVLCCLLFPLSPAQEVHAEERINSFISWIHVQENGDLLVEETITVTVERVNIKHGIYRDFPTVYLDNHNLKRRVNFTLVSVKRNDRDEPYHTEKIKNGIRIYIGSEDALVPEGSQTYSLRYQTNRQLGFFPEHDELYWNVTGNSWLFPIEYSRVTINIPEPGGLDRYEMFTGRMGSRFAKARLVEKNSTTITMETTGYLRPGEGFTTVVSWPKGLIEEPVQTRLWLWFINDFKEIIAACFGLVLLVCYYFFRWLKVGRDPQAGPIIPLYSGPEDFTPQAGRFIMRQGFDQKSFAVLLVNMAVKGVLEIKQDRDDYILHLVSNNSQELTKAERAVKDQLFKQGNTKTIRKKYDSSIKAAGKAMKKQLRKELLNLYFKKNRKSLIPGILISLPVLGAVILSANDIPVAGVMCLWLTGWSVGVVLLVMQMVSRWKGSDWKEALGTTLFGIPFYGGWLVGAFFLYQQLPGVGLGIVLLTLLINLLFAWLLKAPTLSGRAIMDKLEGLRLYLSIAEKEYLNLINPPEKTPQLFEKMLPWAMALDVELEWGEQFTSVLQEAGDKEYRPGWYSSTSHGHFTGMGHISSLGSGFASTLSSASISPSSSSSSSGFSGGSSGGGGGGGGGGGW